jgi:hypothetical protein
MTENIKARWLTDNEQVKIAPKTLVTQILNEDGTRFKKTFEDSVNNINTAIDETNRTIRDHANNTEIHVTAEEKEAWSNIEVPSLDGYATEDYVKSLVKSLNSNLVLSFYCIEDVTVITNGVSETFPANSNVELKFLDTDVFEIVPTSDNSILSLNAYPGALGTYYSWLEGVKLFSNILFDMNNEDMYSKWSQGNQGTYQVQFAQYNNCIFWSDNPYISDVARRTNYTLCATTQLPLCYSTIPENTFKSFYLAFSVNSDPNWSNPLYKNSFAQANWATQAFSYYGARVIGYPGHDSPNFNIILPKDCRGLMFDARNIECAGTFDAINCTNFGAKSGSWREAFGECISLKRLYIKNLKVNLNISWSPIDYGSISYIISKAANTNAITISVSPYTYYLLRDADFSLAASKNITIALLTTNYKEDKRFSTVAYTTGDAEFTGDVIAGGNGGSSPVSLKSVNNLVQSKVDKEEGKGLSTNDFTAEEKEKLAGIEDYVETQIAEYECVIPEGLVGDGVADDFTAIQTAINEHKNIYLPTGTYYISSPLSFWQKQLRFHCEGTLLIKSDISAIKISGNRNDIYVRQITSSGNIGNGIQITGYRNDTEIGHAVFNKIEIGTIRNVNNGIWLNPNGVGIAYNNITFKEIIANRGIFFDPTEISGSYINENIFTGGCINAAIPIESIQNGATDPFNGNKFYNLSLEICTGPMNLRYFQYNHFNHCRFSKWENNTEKLIVLDENSYGNEFNFIGVLFVEQIEDNCSLTIGNFYNGFIKYDISTNGFGIGRRGYSVNKQIIIKDEDRFDDFTVIDSNNGLDQSNLPYAVEGVTYYCDAPTGAIELKLPKGYGYYKADHFYLNLVNNTSGSILISRIINEEQVGYFSEIKENGLYKFECNAAHGWIKTKIENVTLENLRTSGIIMTDVVTGIDYIVQMENGSLVSFPVSVSVNLTSMPSKTTYFAGETVDLSGMVLTATSQDGSLREITKYTYEPSIIAEDTTEIVITYTERGEVYTYNIPVSVEIEITDPALQLVDFNYEVISGEEPTYKITGWKGTTNGVEGTEIIVPNSSKIII